MKSKTKKTSIEIFAKAYGCSYIITVMLFMFRKPLVYLYQDLLNEKLTYQLSEIFVVSEKEAVMALFSPLAIPITSLIMGRWLPQYFLLVIIYFISLFGIYKVSEKIVKREVFTILILLLIFNLIGIYLSISLATSI